MGMKFLLDTNILSEPVKAEPNQNVLKKLSQYSGQFCTAATVWHELHYGVERMTDSKRKLSLSAYLNSLELAGLVILPYEKKAAEWLARERGRLAKQGVVAPFADGEIAAIAFAHQLTLVTRNVSDFAYFENLRVQNWFVE